MKKLKFRTRIALIFFVSYTVLSLSLISLFYFKAVVMQKEQLRQRLMQVSSLGTNLIPANIVETLVPSRASMRTKGYQDLVAVLNKIREVSPNISDAYILVDTTTPGVMKFLANGDPEEIVDCGEKFNIVPYPELAKAVNGPTADQHISQDRWGSWLSGYAPIKNNENTVTGILGIDVAADTIYEMQGLIKTTAIYVFIIGVIISLGAGALTSSWLTKPINILIKGMQRVRSGDLDHKIEVDSSDELGELGKNFNYMSSELKKYIENLTETTKEKERLNRELEIAAEVQQAMLPHYKIDVEGIDLAGLMLPAKQVGGDYFDYMNTDGENVGFVIADATGKGLPSSIFMTKSRSIFKVMTTEEDEPSKVIQRTNDLVVMDMDPLSAMFATMFYGIYNKNSKTFTYTNAGHNPPILIDSQSNKTKLLNVHGCPVGIIADQVYSEDKVQLKKGDTIVLYTDGVVESMNSYNDMFGVQRLMKLVLENKDSSAQGMVDIIRDSVFEFSKNRAQFDDITLLVFQAT